MTSYDVALLLHLVAVIAFFSGITVAAAAHRAARRLERAGEVAAVLGLARTGVLVVAAATVLVLVSGLWLIEETGHSLGDRWVALSLALLLAAALLGAAGGRKPKQARLLADRQKPEDPADAQVAALLGDRTALAANLLATVAAVAILVLMVWRPD